MSCDLISGYWSNMFSSKDASSVLVPKNPAAKILLNLNNIEINFFLAELISAKVKSKIIHYLLLLYFSLPLYLPLFVIHPCFYLLNKYGIELHIQQKWINNAQVFFTSFSVFIFLLLYLTIKYFNASQFLCISILICFSIF